MHRLVELEVDTVLRQVAGPVGQGVAAEPVGGQPVARRPTWGNYAVHWKLLAPVFGPRPPERVRSEDVQAWVNAQTLAPRSLLAYLGTLRQLLDFAQVEPNPARARWVKLPRAEKEAIVPPDARQVMALLRAIPAERRLLFGFIERCGTRISETLGWEWGDVDVEGSRILSRPEEVKGRRGSRKARWVPTPEWLLGLLLERTPYDERSGPLFRWPRRFERPDGAARKTMQRACKAAGIPDFSPHDLRHRRISLWHGQGIPARVIGERVGQRQISTTLDTSTHVMPLDEIPDDELRAVLMWPIRGLDGPEATNPLQTATTAVFVCGNARLFFVYGRVRQSAPLHARRWVSRSARSSLIAR
jgi:integrase